VRGRSRHGRGAAAIVNAVVDALSPLGVKGLDMPAGIVKLTRSGKGGDEEHLRLMPRQ
jgi:proline racemase